MREAMYFGWKLVETCLDLFNDWSVHAYECVLLLADDYRNRFEPVIEYVLENILCTVCDVS